MMPRLLAHEFGHLLGSDHDGDVAKYVFLLLSGFEPSSISLPTTPKNGPGVWRKPGCLFVNSGSS